MAPAVANALNNFWSNAHFKALDKISCTSLSDLAARTANYRPCGEQMDDAFTF